MFLTCECLSCFKLLFNDKETGLIALSLEYILEVLLNVALFEIKHVDDEILQFTNSIKSNLMLLIFSKSFKV